jgi:hypothetical protein
LLHAERGRKSRPSLDNRRYLNGLLHVRLCCKLFINGWTDSISAFNQLSILDVQRSPF